MSLFCEMHLSVTKTESNTIESRSVNIYLHLLKYALILVMSAGTCAGAHLDAYKTPRDLLLFVCFCARESERESESERTKA